MHKVTAKRQITLPQAVCQSMNLNPGDYVVVFERDGVAHIVKMTDKNLAEAQANYAKINEFIQARMQHGLSRGSDADSRILEFIKKFDSFLDNDFNTAAAVNLLLAFINKFEHSSSLTRSEATPLK